MSPAGREPFKDFLAIQDRMNRLFEAAFTEPKMGENPAEVGAWSPVSDLIETPESLVLLCELPGIDEKQIDIRVAEGVLTISGERRMDNEGAGGRFHRVERSYGPFSRKFLLPSAVAADSVSASYRDGVLAITLPRKAEGSARRVNIQIG